MATPKQFMTTQAMREKMKFLPLSHYERHPEQIPAVAKDLVINYGHIPPAQVVRHIIRVRDEALEEFFFPSIGSLRFLNFSLAARAVYPEILQRLKEGQKLLDVGCCFGADVRKVIYDGAPAENCFGSDLSRVYLELGYELFNDGDRMRGQFMVADIFKLDEEPRDDHAELNALKGDIDIIYASSFFHLFSRAGQIKLGTILVSILRPMPGSLLVGRQAGTIKAGERTEAALDGGPQFRHDVESFRQMWVEIGELTGTKWRMEGSLDQAEMGPEARKAEDREVDEHDRRLLFEVRRL